MKKEVREYLESLDLDELEDEYVQEYIICLLDGTQIRVYEDYNLPMEKGLLGWFKKAKPEEIIEVETLVHSDYIPKRSILYIATGEVSKAEFPYKLGKKERA